MVGRWIFVRPGPGGKVRERGDKSVRVVAQELNMSEGTLRKWITKSNQNRCRWSGSAYFSLQ